ncbi:MAG: hypothetical protein HKN45_12550 [Flavobacteriales bacterium]|nr:hypothetical protein [Flavobacteriales bacterium]
MPQKIESRRRARWGFDYLNYGAYADQVAHYMSRFPHCKVYLTEDLKDKQSLINDITEFLSVDRLEIRDEVTANPSGIPKSRFLVDQMRKNRAMKWMVNQLPETTKHKLLNKRDKMMSKLLVKEPMRTDTREMLKTYYQDDLLKLESIIGRSLEHWR